MTDFKKKFGVSSIQDVVKGVKDIVNPAGKIEGADPDDQIAQEIQALTTLVKSVKSDHAEYVKVMSDQIDEISDRFVKLHIAVKELRKQSSALGAKKPARPKRTSAKAKEEEE